MATGCIACAARFACTAISPRTEFVLPFSSCSMSLIGRPAATSGGERARSSAKAVLQATRRPAAKVATPWPMLSPLRQDQQTDHAHERAGGEPRSGKASAGSAHPRRHEDDKDERGTDQAAADDSDDSLLTSDDHLGQILPAATMDELRRAAAGPSAARSISCLPRPGRCNANSGSDNLAVSPPGLNPAARGR
jgi:hypothetical protein